MLSKVPPRHSTNRDFFAFRSLKEWRAEYERWKAAEGEFKKNTYKPPTKSYPNSQFIREKGIPNTPNRKAAFTCTLYPSHYLSKELAEKELKRCARSCPHTSVILDPKKAVVTGWTWNIDCLIRSLEVDKENGSIADYKLDTEQTYLEPERTVERGHVQRVRDHKGDAKRPNATPEISEFFIHERLPEAAQAHGNGTGVQPGRSPENGSR